MAGDRTEIGDGLPLAGFGMAVLFAGTLTFALHIVTDMEYPRLGLFRIDAFDHFLTDTLAQMG